MSDQHGWTGRTSHKQSMNAGLFSIAETPLLETLHLNRRSDLFSVRWKSSRRPSPRTRVFRGGLLRLCAAIVFLILSAATPHHGWCRESYIFPDFHRLLRDGKMTEMTLGISLAGTLFLVLNGNQYEIPDPDAFRKGTDLAMENTQKYQKNNHKNGIQPPAAETLVLYTSPARKNSEPQRFFTMTFTPSSPTGRYPIRLSFHDGPNPPDTFDIPPGELEYLQQKIDLILEDKEKWIKKIGSAEDQNP